MNPTMEPAQTQPPVIPANSLFPAKTALAEDVGGVTAPTPSVFSPPSSEIAPIDEAALTDLSPLSDATTPKEASQAEADASQGGLPASTVVLAGKDLNVADQKENALIQEAMSSVAEAVSSLSSPPSTPSAETVVPQISIPESPVLPVDASVNPSLPTVGKPLVPPAPVPSLRTRGISQVSSVIDILLDGGAISQDQYDDISLEHVSTGKGIEAILEEKQVVTSEVLTKARAELYHVPFITISEIGVSPEALGQVPAVLAKRYELIPFSLDKARRTLSIAMKNPLDLGAIDFLEKKTGLRVTAYYAIPSEIDQAITDRYAQSLSAEVSAAVRETSGESSSQVRVKTFDSKNLGSVIREAPIAKIVETILTFAIKARASDVHLEPQEDRTRVRYRIDGILHEKLILPKSVQDAVVSRIKILSDLKIDEKRIPQDGRFTFRVEKEEVDLRISTLPTVHGEKIVMRLLKKTGGVPTLNELGLRGSALKSLETAALVPHGIILVTGPTGSGKTTTLYSLLYKINTPKVNIMTLEDPVEYQMAGINQVQINPGAGLTFASGLRSFLRQDPNIIMVGEIRDSETAELAIQASLTGHLVFSTLHTNSAAGALPRMLDMGAEPFLLTSSVTLVMAQRVVRKICPDCKEEYVPEQVVQDDMKKVLGSLFDGWVKEHQGKLPTLYRGKGCDTCGNSGYQGRIGIFEVLVVNEKVGRLILERRPAQEIEEQGAKDGMLLMKQDGYMKALDGTTSIEEVLRVAQV